MNPLFVSILAALGGLCIVSFAICALYMARLSAVGALSAKSAGSRKRRRRSDRNPSTMAVGRATSGAVWI